MVNTNDDLEEPNAFILCHLLSKVQKGHAVKHYVPVSMNL